MNENDAVVMLRVLLIQKMGNNIENLKIKIGRQYSWGWSLYYQDKRPEHLLVGHGPVFINKNTNEVIENGSAYSEEYHAERYEYKIGIRDRHKVVLNKFDKSDTHLRHILKKADVDCANVIRLPMVLYCGPKPSCMDIGMKLSKAGLEVAILEDYEVA